MAGHDLDGENTTSIKGKYKKILFFSCISHKLLDKIFTFEKKKSIPFFSLNQIFRIFALGNLK